MPVVIVVDSGTTTTRVRLWDGTGVAASIREQVGARDTAADGHPGQVRTALRRMIARVRAESSVEPEAVLCSGMITSNVGLLEVPHLPAPAGPGDLARQMVRHPFPEVTDLPFCFIPGVKSLPEAGWGAATLAQADIMRGEETEVCGLRALLSLSGPGLFLHYGSHHKAIAVDLRGRILRSRTSMTGELLMAVAQQTVLRSSLVPLGDDLIPNPAMWRLGLAQGKEGFGTALFLTRIMEQLWERSKEDATSYLLGVLMSLDLPLLEVAADRGPVVLYGRGAFPQLMSDYLGEQGWSDIRLVGEELAELAAVVGAVQIYEQSARGGHELA